MALSREFLKSGLRRTGLYASARHAYRRLSPSTRRERALLKAFYRELVTPGDLCFDIGANVGQTTEALIGCGSSRVITVEPNPLCAPVLAWQFGRDPRVALVRKAVGAERGTAVLRHSGTNATASLRSDWRLAGNDSTEVEVTTLEELIAEFGRPAFLKVDVEGFEAEVFRGLRQPIRIVYFEAHRRELPTAKEVLSSLAQLGEGTVVNMTDENHSGWLCNEWIPLESFCERLEETTLRIVNVVLKMSF